MLEQLARRAAWERDFYKRCLNHVDVCEQVALDIINKCETPIEYISLDGITPEVVFRSEQGRRLVYEIAKKFGVSFKKSFYRLTGCLAYHTKMQGVVVVVRGITDIPKCTIRKKRIVEEREVYVLDCGGDGEQQIRDD